MKPPAPVSGEISVETARMPVGRIAAMKPEPSAFTSFCSRIGSPAMNGARAIEPTISVGGVGPFAAADEGAAGGRRRPGLPLHILRLDRLAEADVGFRDQNVDGLQLRDRLRPAAAVLSDPLARYAAMPPAPTAMVRTTMRAVFIRFTFHITPRRFRRRDGS